MHGLDPPPLGSMMSPMPDALDNLAALIGKGLNEKSPDLLALVRALFGTRYYQNDWKSDDGVRNRYAMSEDGVPFGALLHPDNPSSGAYGGFSLAWFPTPEGSLMTLVVGTRGLQPDEGILTRPGHRRRVAALRRYLTRTGVVAWAKADPASIGVKMPPQTLCCWGNGSRARMTGTATSSMPPPRCQPTIQPRLGWLFKPSSICMPLNGAGGH